MACRGHEESTELCDLLPIAEEAVVSAVFHLYYKLRHQGVPILTQLLADLQNARKGKLLWSLDIVALNQKIADITRQDRLLAQLKQQGLVGPDILYPAKTSWRNNSAPRSWKRNGSWRPRKIRRSSRPRS